VRHNRKQCKQAEDPHPQLIKQRSPLAVIQLWRQQNVAHNKNRVCQQNNSTGTLQKPVGNTAAPHTRDVGYHSHTPAKIINITANTRVSSALLRPRSEEHTSELQ